MNIDEVERWENLAEKIPMFPFTWIAKVKRRIFKDEYRQLLAESDYGYGPVGYADGFRD